MGDEKAGTITVLGSFGEVWEVPIIYNPYIDGAYIPFYVAPKGVASFEVRDNVLEGILESEDGAFYILGESRGEATERLYKNNAEIEYEREKRAEREGGYISDLFRTEKELRKVEEGDFE